MGRFKLGFPYDRIMAGDWQPVIEATIARGPEGNWDVYCVFELLSQHARVWPVEASLVLPLLQGLNVAGKTFINSRHRRALLNLVEVARPLTQKEADELIYGMVNHTSFGCLELVTERGYAPSPSAEKAILRWCEENPPSMSWIQRMQPRWHAMRLQAEMRDLTTVNARSSEVRAGPGL